MKALLLPLGFGVCVSLSLPACEGEPSEGTCSLDAAPSLVCDRTQATDSPNCIAFTGEAWDALGTDFEAQCAEGEGVLREGTCPEDGVARMCEVDVGTPDAHVEYWYDASLEATGYANCVDQGGQWCEVG